MGDFDFGTPEELRELNEKKRKPPLTFKRVGQLVGGIHPCVSGCVRDSTFGLIRLV